MDTYTLRKRQLVENRIINFPVAKVWEAWTDATQLAQWWAPEGFTTTVLKMNVAVNEEWLLTLHGPDGKNYPNKSIFKEVVPLKKIVYEHFNPGFIATVTFKAIENATHMQWILAFDTDELFEIVVKTFKANEGLKQNVEKLIAYLTKTSAGTNFGVDSTEF